MTAEPSEPLDLAALRRDWVELPTLGDLIVRRAAHGPETDAIVFPESRETGAALLGASLDTARSLLGLGIRPGATVAILMPNTPDFLHVFFGCRARRREGAARQRPLQGLRARLRAQEARRGRRRHHGRGLRLRRLRAALNEATAPRPPLLRHLILLATSSPDGYLNRAAFAAAGGGMDAADVERLRESVRVRDVAILMYTSGTTAAPEGLPDHARGARADHDQRRAAASASRPATGSGTRCPSSTWAACSSWTATLWADGAFLDA